MKPLPTATAARIPRRRHFPARFVLRRFRGDAEVAVHRSLPFRPAATSAPRLYRFDANGDCYPVTPPTPFGDCPTCGEPSTYASNSEVLDCQECFDAKERR